MFTTESPIARFEEYRVANAPTIMAAVAVLPEPKLVEVTLEVVLVRTPSDIAVTFTLNVQAAPPASVAPARLINPVPLTAVMAPASQDPASPLGVATSNPAGIVSVKATPLRARVAFGLVMVKLSVVVPPNGIETMPAGNDLLMTGGSPIVRVAVAVFPAPATASVA
jgi:hypothetical protein